MTINSVSAEDTAKEELPSNYLTGQIPAIELPLHPPPRLVTLAPNSTSNIVKEYGGGERPSTPPQDTSDPRVFSRTHSSALSSTHTLHPSDSVDVSSSQSQTVMSSVIYCQSRDQIRKELNQNYDFLITLREAQKGKPEAQFNLGLRYVHGKGVDQDETQALYWFRKAAEQGDAGAQFNLGVMYEQGQGVTQDETQALDWYLKAAEQGHVNAQFNLGLMYAHGKGVEANDALAMNWYRKAAEQGHAGAQFNLGDVYARSKGVEANYALALEWCRKAAAQGHAGAQFNLGVMYAYGIGVDQDHTQAVNWYRRAAEQGHANAQFYFGGMYAYGIGVDQDQTKALDWWRKAAEQGNVGAQFNLGVMYAYGIGVDQDQTQALGWYRRAAEQGHADAQCNLGCMYQLGRGVTQDDDQAVNWYRKAAAQGHANAQCNLGVMYEFGLGVEKDYAQSLDWYSKAAAQDYADAQLQLASVYKQGLGVKKDVLQATYWFLKSANKDKRGEIVLNGGKVAEHFYSDVIQCIPAALTTFPEFKYIKTISFKNIELSEQDFVSIGQMIRANPPLEGLNLEEQDLDDADALILSQSLAFNTTLTELIFDDEYDFDTSIFNEIKASLAQNVIIAELREGMKGHLITAPDGLPIRVPYITRSDELPLEVLEIIVDNMIVEASKVGKDKKSIIAGIDEFLLSVSRETLKYDLKKSS